MRELKFRAWHKILRNYAHIKRIWLDGDGDDHDEIFAVSDAETTYSIHEIVLEQYTGIKDKNGKEIYEGDIILVANHGRTPYAVIYREGDCSFVCKNENLKDFVHMFKTMPQCYEVIGNIHENPELLEQEKK